MNKLFFIVCLMSVPFSIFAQTEALVESRQIARDIVISQEANARLPNFFRQSGITMRQQMAETIKRDNPNLTAAQLSRVSQLYGDATAQGIEAWMKDSLPKIQDATIDLYVRRFSLQELQQLKIFHTSDLGKKSLSVTMEELPELIAPLVKDAGQFGGTMGKRFVEIYMQLESEGIVLQKK